MPLVHWPGHASLQNKPLRQAVEILNNSMQSPSHSWASGGCSSTHLGIHRAPGSMPVRECQPGEIYRVPASEAHCLGTGGQTVPKQYSWALQRGIENTTSQTTLAWKNGWFFFSKSFLISNSGASLRIIFHHTSIRDIYAYSHPMQGPS